VWTWLLGMSLAAAGSCPDGQRRAPNALGQCCWPGQRWSRSEEACLGMPHRCPDGWSVELGSRTLPEAAGCADIPNLFANADWSAAIPGLPGRVDAWGADPRLGPALQWALPELQGAIAKQRIDAVLREHRTELVACVDKARTKDPTATGVVRVRWTVDAKGRARSVRVTENTLRHWGARACLANAVDDLTFPPPLYGRATVAYSFVLGASR